MLGRRLLLASVAPEENYLPDETLSSSGDLLFRLWGSSRPGWHRVGIWENRMLRNLKLFASRKDDFKHIQQTVAAIVDVKPMDVASHAPSVVICGGTDAQSGKGKATAERPALPLACIPFIGWFPSYL